MKHLIVVASLLIGLCVEAQKPAVWIISDGCDKELRQMENPNKYVTDPDDISAIASYLLMSNLFDTRGIVVGSNDGISLLPKVADQAEWAENYFGAAYQADLEALNKEIGGYQESHNFIESSLVRKGMDYDPEKEYKSLRRLKSVKALVDEVERSEELINVLCWGKLTEAAIFVNHCSATGKEELLDKVRFISHWTASYYHVGSMHNPDSVHNSFNDAEACRYLKAQAAQGAIDFYECGAIGQAGLVEGGHRDKDYYEKFKTSQLGKLYAEGKYIPKGPYVDNSDAATFWVLSNDWGVTLEDLNADGSMTAEQEKRNEQIFHQEAPFMQDEMLSRVHAISGDEEYSQAEVFWINPPTGKAKGIDDIDKEATTWIVLDQGELAYDSELQKKLESFDESKRGKLTIVMPHITSIADGFVISGKCEGAFSDAHAIKVLHLPNLNYVGDYAFTRCSEVRNIEFPESATIGKAVFYGADHIKHYAKGAQFVDRFLPLPKQELKKDVWGAAAVIPRYVDNGIEDADYSYWGGNILKGDDGKYHMFVARWPQDNTLRKGEISGHHTWFSSTVAHAVSDSPTGPYKVIEDIGKGHNPEAYRRKDGSYVVGVMGLKHYSGPTINGPWREQETKIKYSDDEQFENNSNRTYIVEDDGQVFMVNKEGFVFESANADEDFIGLQAIRTSKRKNKSHEEDPVIWKDEVCYNIIMNECLGRVAYHFTSKDGRSEWTREDGIAYTPDVVTHEDGHVEKWWKLERPKVLVDEFGRPTHMNFAAVDTLKSFDLANDNHSSKNVVVPLRVARRLELVSPVGISDNIFELKILAESGFDPQKEIDLNTLTFGNDNAVNVSRGAKAVKSKNSGKDLIITFEGNSEFNTNDYKGKLLGNLKNGEPLWGYVRID